MPTNREIYFQLTKENNKYLNRNVVLDFLVEVNQTKDRMELYTIFDNEVKNFETFLSFVDLARKGIPHQYILGYSYFLGQKIIVDKNVLIPRQETEQLTVDTIVAIKKIFKSDETPVIADVCTGSGAIASVMERELPNAKIYATDISKDALEIAKKNVKKVELLQGNLLDPLIENHVKVDVLICNPPYIEDTTRIDKQVWDYEPHLALLATPGTKCYEEIFIKAKEIFNEHYFMAFEIEDDMEKPLIELMNKYLDGVSYRFHKDIYEKTRFLYIMK